MDTQRALDSRWSWTWWLGVAVVAVFAGLGWNGSFSLKYFATLAAFVFCALTANPWFRQTMLRGRKLKPKPETVALYPHHAEVKLGASRPTTTRFSLTDTQIDRVGQRVHFRPMNAKTVARPELGKSKVPVSCRTFWFHSQNEAREFIALVRDRQRQLRSTSTVGKQTGTGDNLATKSV